MRSSSSSACKYSSYSAHSSPYRLPPPLRQPADYPDQLFSFDDMPNADRKQMLWELEMEPPCDLIAVSLIEENQELRNQLRQNEKRINQLENELSLCRLEI